MKQLPMFSLRNGRVTLATDFYPRTKRTALRRSIQKWEYIKTCLETNQPIDSDGGSQSCGLCILYNHPNQTEANWCSGCPVSEATGLPSCSNTPYEELWSHGAATMRYSIVRDEIAFLKDLYRERYGTK